MFDRNTLQIAEMATVAKSLPRSLKNTHKWLIYNIFLFIYRILRKKRKGDMSLYKAYQDDGFKHDLRIVIDRMLGDLDYVR